MGENTPQIVELDVRPQLRKKLEPFQIIMESVKSLHKEDTFILHTTFKPTPLLGIMKTKGFNNEVTQVADDHWTITFIHKKNPNHEIKEEASPSSTNFKDEPQSYELDNRGLEPPQPMIRTLKKLEEAQVGDMVIIHNDRVPMFLIEELNTLGYKYHIEEETDGSAQVTIYKT